MKKSLQRFLLNSIFFTCTISPLYADGYISDQHPNNNGYVSTNSAVGYINNPPVDNSGYSSSTSNTTTTYTNNPEKQRKNPISVSINFNPFNGTQPIQIKTHHGHKHHQLNWVEMRPGLPFPRHTIVGGYEHGQPLYLCRANYNGGIHPGKLIAQQCNITWGGNEIRLSHYQILVGQAKDLNWTWTTAGRIPAAAIEGGYEHGQPLYICQAAYRGGMHPGKIVAGRCNIGYGGRELTFSSFKTLVVW